MRGGSPCGVCDPCWAVIIGCSLYKQCGYEFVIRSFLSTRSTQSLRLPLHSKMFSLPAPRIYDQPLVQAIFEGNSEQLMELISQQEEINAQVQRGGRCPRSLCMRCHSAAAAATIYSDYVEVTYLYMCTQCHSLLNCSLASCCTVFVM